VDFPAPVPGSNDLHLVTGANEAGKSTALRALLGLLYGIDERTDDAHRFAAKDLMIEGLLEHDGEAPWTVRRRKGRKETLLLADGKTPADEHRLRRWLGGMEKDDFALMHAFGHERLREGGDALAHGKGSLHEALFAGATGLAGVRALMQTLDDKAEELYRQRGSTQRLTLKLKELQACAKQADGDLLDPREWDRQRYELEEARAKRRRIESELRDVEIEKQRWQRRADAVRLMAERAEILGQLEALGDAPPVPAGFAQRREAAEGERHAARTALRTAEEQAEALAARLAQPEPDAALAAEVAALRSLQEGVGAYRRDREQRAALEQELAALRVDAERQRVRLGLPANDTPPVWPAIANERLTALGEALNRCRHHELTALESARAIEREIEELRAEIAQAPALADLAELERLQAAIANAQRLGGIEDVPPDVDRQLVTLEPQTVALVARLSLGSHPLDALDALSVPRRADVESARKALEKAEARCETAAAQCKKLEQQANKLKRECERARAACAVPDGMLHEARRERDAAWHLLMESWRAGAPAPDATQEAAALRLTARADTLADDRLREAEALAKLEQLGSQRDDVVAELAEATQAFAASEAAAADVIQRHAAQWIPSGITPSLPAGMLEWLDEFAKLRDSLGAIRDLKLRRTEAVRSIDAAVSNLRKAFGALGWEPAAGTLTGMLDEAARRAIAAREESVRRQAVPLRLEKLQTQDAPRARQAATQAGQQRAEAEAAWAAVLATLGLDPQATPAEAMRRHSAWEELRRTLDGMAKQEGLAKQAREREERFEQAARPVVVRCRPSLAAQPPDVSWELLLVEAEREAKAVAERERLKADAAAAQASRAASARRLAEADQAMARLVAEAAVASELLLPQAELRAERLRELEQQLGKTESALRAVRGNDDTPMPAESNDPASMEQVRSELEERHTDLKARSAEVSEVIGKLAAVVEKTDPTAGYADRVQQQRSLASEVADLAREYTLWRVARRLLERAMESFRESGTSSMLLKTSEYFTLLTLGSFTGVSADTADDGTPRLMGRRPNDTTLAPTAMSDGTRDQLFLALRLAGLEGRLDTATPLPLILDDIFVHFDDHRTVAGLKALAQLARRTQVIVFTHHPHLTQLARTALAPGDFRASALSER